MLERLLTWIESEQTVVVVAKPENAFGIFYDGVVERRITKKFEIAFTDLVRIVIVTGDLERIGIDACNATGPIGPDVPVGVDDRRRKTEHRFGVDSIVGSMVMPSHLRLFKRIKYTMILLSESSLIIRSNWDR